MSKTLILPDVHNRWYVLKHTIESVNWDKCVTLGDYFDNFGENFNDVIRTAEVVESLSHNDNIYLLSGNHDAPVLWGLPKVKSESEIKPWMRCPGWTIDKHNVINQILGDRRDRFLIHTFVDDWILSHAGFNRYLVGDGGPLEVGAHIEAESHNFLQAARAGGHHPWFSCGRERGGRDVVGGPLWEDFSALRSPAQCNQIVGHTNLPHVRYYEALDGSMTCCIDTFNLAYGVIEDSVLTVHDTPKNWLVAPR